MINQARKAKREKIKIEQRLSDQQKEEEYGKAVQRAMFYKQRNDLLVQYLRFGHAPALRHEILRDLILFMFRRLRMGDMSIINQIDPDPLQNKFFYDNYTIYEHSCRRIFWELFCALKDVDLYPLIRSMCEHEALLTRDGYIMSLEKQVAEMEQKLEDKSNDQP